MQRLNPAQYRLLERHVQRAVEALEEADRLLRGSVSELLTPQILQLKDVLHSMDRDEVEMVSFELEDLPLKLVPYVDDPFVQGLTFNLFCIQEGLSHTKAKTEWPGGTAAVAARNLVFLPTSYRELYQSGLIDKTRLIHIADRALKDEGYEQLEELVRAGDKEEIDDFLLRTPANLLRVGRRGPDQALEAAEDNGWMDLLEEVRIPRDLVNEVETQAKEQADSGEPGEVRKAGVAHEPWEEALTELRSGLGGAQVSEPVVKALQMSPDPHTLVERYLTAHRQSGDADPDDVSQTLFFAHAGPVLKMVADDKFLLRHFEPVKTQKRGQLFYKLLETIEGLMLERQHHADLAERGVREEEATRAVRDIVKTLNNDANRYLVLEDIWLGEVTRRHLYFGSRTRKEGSAYKWFRKIDDRYFLGGHKTLEELQEKEERRKAKANA